MSELMPERANFARFSPIHMAFRRKCDGEFPNCGGFKHLGEGEEDESRSNVLDFGGCFEKAECSETYDSILCNDKDRSSVFYTYINSISDSSDVPDIFINSISNQEENLNEVREIFEQFENGGKVSLEQLNFAMNEAEFRKKYKYFSSCAIPLKGWMCLDELMRHLKLE